MSKAAYLPSFLPSRDIRPTGIAHSVLVARRFGWRYRLTVDALPIEAVTSLGTVFSMPLAIGYIPAFVRTVRKGKCSRAPRAIPLTDLAILLGLPADVALVIYWHADIVGYPRLKRLT